MRTAEGPSKLINSLLPAEAGLNMNEERTALKIVDIYKHSEPWGSLQGQIACFLKWNDIKQIKHCFSHTYYEQVK